MGSYKQHIAGGLIATFLLVLVFNYLRVDLNFLQYLTWIPISFIYSQLPDIDHQSSKIRWIFTVVFLIGAMSFMYFDYKILAMLFIASLIFVYCMKYIKGFGHRGVTHTAFAGIAFSLPLVLFSNLFFFVGLVNYLSHLVLDITWDDHRRN